MVIGSQTIYNMLARKMAVDPLDLLEDSKRLYTSIRLDGVEDTSVRYADKSEKLITNVSDELFMKMRCVADATETLIFRWKEKDEKFIRQVFNLPHPIADILNIHDCYGRRNDVLPCINVANLIQSCTGMSTEGASIEVEAQSLYNLTERLLYVGPVELDRESEHLYTAIKAVGLEHTKVKYIDEYGNNVEKVGDEIPEAMRAMAGAEQTLIYRWHEKDERRLRVHLGLEYPIVDILGIYSCYGRNNDVLPYITVEKLIQSYTGIHKPASCIGFQAQSLYDFSERKMYQVPWVLLKDAERLYKAIKFVGLEATKVKYTNEHGEVVEKTGHDIPQTMRGVSGAVETLMYMWSEESLQRLCQHLGLQLPILDVLGMSRLQGSGNDILAYETVKKFMQSYM